MKVTDLIKTFIISGTLITIFKYAFTKLDPNVAAIWISIPLSFFAALMFSPDPNKTLYPYVVQLSFTYMVIFIAFLLSLKYKINTYFIIGILLLWIFFASCHTFYIVKNKIK